jgi:hypothetical protein
MLSASCLPPPSAAAADRPSGQHRAERHDRPAVAAGDHDGGRGLVPEPGPGRLAVGAARSRLGWRIKDLS